MKKKEGDEINLLKRALKLAAIEAYQTEVIDTDMQNNLIGNEKQFSSIKDWIQTRTDSWLQEAELIK